MAGQKRESEHAQALHADSPGQKHPENIVHEHHSEKTRRDPSTSNSNLQARSRVSDEIAVDEQTQSEIATDQ